MRRAFLFLVFAALIAAAPARADDPVFICAHALETQKMYHAMAWTTTGVNLNNVSNSSAYDPLANFVVVAWDQHRATIIKMDGLFASPTYVPAEGIDQAGGHWEISLYSWSTCP
jgi:hypothetical protein